MAGTAEEKVCNIELARQKKGQIDPLYRQWKTLLKARDLVQDLLSLLIEEPK